MAAVFRGHARRGLESRLIWILGSPRSGSTWLLNLLAGAPRAVKLDEPAIGVHLAVLMSGLLGLRPEEVVPTDRMRLNDVRAGSPDYFFSDAYAASWRPGLRRLILDRLGAQLGHQASRRDLGRRPIALIKEPHGSQGADVLMSLLPRSRLLFLVRDGRDSLDSALDAASSGAWGMASLTGYRTADRDRMAFLRDRANTWLCRIEAVQRAYRSHADDLRLQVRYEDLLATPAVELQRIVGWAGLDLGPTAIAAVVDALSVSRLDPGLVGPGRFVRAATTGTWQENWTVDEQQAVEEIIGHKLGELGYR